MQKHWDVMRSDNAGDQWTKISGNLPTDFGFVIDVHAHEPETIYVIPIKSDGEHFVHEGKLRVFRSKTGGNEWEALTKGLPQKNCYVNVLRDAMAVDTLDKCGIYFGTTGGQVYVSPDGGDSWSPIVRDLPAVLSVEVQTLAMSAAFSANIRGRFAAFRTLAGCVRSAISSDTAVGVTRTLSRGEDMKRALIAVVVLLSLARSRNRAGQASLQPSPKARMRSKQTCGSFGKLSRKKTRPRSRV